MRMNFEEENFIILLKCIGSFVSVFGIGVLLFFCFFGIFLSVVLVIFVILIEVCFSCWFFFIDGLDLVWIFVIIVMILLIVGGCIIVVLVFCGWRLKIWYILFFREVVILENFVDDLENFFIFILVYNYVFY